MLGRDTFLERRDEVDKLLQYLEESEGPPAAGLKVPRGETLRILRASCHVMIYNMIESTISMCLEDLSSAVQRSASSINDLNEKVFERYLISKYNKRLMASSNEKAVLLARELMNEVEASSITEFTLSAPSGNCNDKNIERILKSVGIDFQIDGTLKSQVKRVVSDERSALDSLVRIRNDLAHGNRAFSDVGKDSTAIDLRSTFTLAVEYLDVVISHFEDYIRDEGYLC